jgi:hypothetical protein
LFDPCPGGFCDIDGNPINPQNARFIVDPDNRTNIAGRNILRSPKINSLDLSLNKAFGLPFEKHKVEIRVEFFNVFNRPQFTWDGTQSNGDVTNSFFNRPDLNDGGNRTGRIQVRYSF